MHLTPGGAPDWSPDPRALKVTVGGHCAQRQFKAAVTPGAMKSVICLDLLCLCVVSTPFLICELGLVAPIHHGFFCDDVTIQFPENRQETIFLGECHRVPRKCGPSVGYIAAVYSQLLPFLFGSALSQSLTNTAKLSAGRLRPNFLSVCRPEALNCTMGYIQSYRCTGDSGAVTEARKSFYSGHASFAMYSMMYLSFYLQSWLTWRGARLLRPLLQFVLIIVALYTGLSRISDHRHHPSDVVVGFLQGALVAYWVAFHISNMFRQKSSQSLPLHPQTVSPETFTNC
ncbi:phospholipid phosphatase 3-like isoform X2 [Ascaphus truei]|uniref:phospholipid phosphatase 3-like isoform X2 n=1 Tax=Ascaphus truei TaxID=8439 RepID=UPI003F595E2C